MLPTLAVILWAYGMYALFSYIFQRKGGTSRSQSRGRKLSGFAMVGGMLGLGLLLWCCHSTNKQNQRLQLAGFLGTVYAEGVPERVDKQEYPAFKDAAQRAGEQPTYALLHPGTPAGQLEPEKKLIRPRPTRVVKKRHTSKVNEKAHKNGKIKKTVSSSSKKDKLAAKSHVKRKKRTSARRSRPTNAG